jgi:hypothetical protein
VHVVFSIGRQVPNLAKKDLNSSQQAKTLCVTIRDKPTEVEKTI